MALALDVASTEFYADGRYALVGEGRELAPSELVGLLAELSGKYPIVSIEDGCAEEDWDGWAELTKTLGDRIQLVGDDLFVTNVERLQRGIDVGWPTASWSRSTRSARSARRSTPWTWPPPHGYGVVMSPRSGETEDSTIADLAVATNCGQIKAGAAARSDRVAKYNQLLRIEDDLGEAAAFRGRSAVARAGAGRDDRAPAAGRPTDRAREDPVAVPVPAGRGPRPRWSCAAPTGRRGRRQGDARRSTTTPPRRCPSPAHPRRPGRGAAHAEPAHRRGRRPRGPAPPAPRGPGGHGDAPAAGRHPAPTTTPPTTAMPVAGRRPPACAPCSRRRPRRRRPDVRRQRVTAALAGLGAPPAGVGAGAPRRAPPAGESAALAGLGAPPAGVGAGARRVPAATV